MFDDLHASSVAFGQCAGEFARAVDGTTSEVEPIAAAADAVLRAHEMTIVVERAKAFPQTPMPGVRQDWTETEIPLRFTVKSSPRSRAAGRIAAAGQFRSETRDSTRRDPAVRHSPHHPPTPRPSCAEPCEVRRHCFGTEITLMVKAESSPRQGDRRRPSERSARPSGCSEPAAARQSSHRRRLA